MTTVHEALVCALDKLNTLEWIKGNYFKYDEPVHEGIVYIGVPADRMNRYLPDKNVVGCCAEGAVMLCTLEDPDLGVEVTEALVEEFETSRFEELTEFNDDGLTKKEDVIQLFERAVEATK